MKSLQSANFTNPDIWKRNFNVDTETRKQVENKTTSYRVWGAERDPQ